LSKSIQQTIEKAKADGLVAPEVDTNALAFFLEVLPLGDNGWQLVLGPKQLDECAGDPAALVARLA